MILQHSGYDVTAQWTNYYITVDILLQHIGYDITALSVTLVFLMMCDDIEYFAATQTSK